MNQTMLTRLTDLGAATSAALSIGVAHVVTLTNDAQIPDVSGGDGDLLRWALKESALLVVILIVLFFYRRDFKNKGRTDTALVRESVEVNTELKGQVERLARAIEEMNQRHRRDDPEHGYFDHNNQGNRRR